MKLVLLFFRFINNYIGFHCNKIRFYLIGSLRDTLLHLMTPTTNQLFMITVIGRELEFEMPQVNLETKQKKTKKQFQFKFQLNNTK